MNAERDNISVPMVLEDPQEVRALRREVLIVCLANGLGGSTRSLATLLGGLGSSFRRVLATPGQGPFLRLLRTRGSVDGHLEIPNDGVGARGKLSRLHAMAEILKWVRRHRHVVQVIHANGPEELNLVIPAALLWKVPVVVWSHARDVSPWMRRLRFLLRPLVRRIDVQWSAVSDQARDVLVEGGLATKESVRIIPNPIDPRDVIGPRSSSSDKVVIGYLGSDAPYKGFLLLPDVIAALGDAPVEWLVFSNERSSKSSDAWRRLRALPTETVSLVGKLADVSEAYAQCDIVFMPSLDESFGRVAAEAMLNGLPVVASDLPPVREVMNDGAAGSLFAPGDVDAAARCLRGLLDDPEERARMGERGKQLAGRFEPTMVVAELTALYERDRRLVAG